MDSADPDASTNLRRCRSINKLIVAALATTLCAQERNPFANDPQAAEAGKPHARMEARISWLSMIS